MKQPSGAVAVATLRLPRVEAMTVLHGRNSRVDLTEAAASRVWALDGYNVTGVPSVRELLDQPPRDLANSIDGPRARQIVAIIEAIGLKPLPKVRKVGEYEIERAAHLGDGPGWVDVRAKHPFMRHAYRRIRLYDVPPGAGKKERQQIERAARREIELVHDLAHPGIVKPVDILITDEGPALVFQDDADSVPLAEYVGDERPPADVRLSLVRQLGEILDYAHKRRVQHRALTPTAVRVTPTEGGPRVTVRDWQTGRRDEDESVATASVYAGVSGVRDLVAEDAWLYLAPEAHQPDPEGVGLDVYGLGALAYLTLTGSPPAADLAALHDRLAHGGLDPRAVDDGLAPEVCDVVRRATDPDLVDRISSVAEFLDDLSSAVAAGEKPPKPAPKNPLNAEIGDIIAERWEVKNRLGTGGAGTALLVDDHQLVRESLVLKIANDADAEPRLADEAEALRALDHPRVVRLVDGPLDADGHAALLIEDAGRPTLGRRILDEGRLTLEQLQNYGRDLFEVMSYLDDRGVFHRDIKPDNLGVREDRGDRSRHLVLFDFSLSNEPLDHVLSGTPGYLDPFFTKAGRQQYDSAAERFAVAATLFEMATGTRPEWGDGRSNPAMIDDEVYLTESMFEPEVAADLMGFFRVALARTPAQRFDDLTSMAQAWLGMFAPATVPGGPEVSDEERQRLADEAQPSTPLGQAGLTAQAVSAARRLDAETVQHLMDASAVKINQLPGVGVLVRSELQRHRRAWRARFADRSVVEESVTLQLRGVEATQSRLVPPDRTKAATASPLARRLLNIDQPHDASTWPDLATAAAEAGLDGDPIEYAGLLAGYWARTQAGKALLGDVSAALQALGGLATVDEIAERLVALRGSDAEGIRRRTNAVGLVRAAVEGDAGATLAILRHGDAVLITAADSPAPDERLEAAAALAAAIDDALTDVTEPLGPNVGLDLVRRHPRADETAIGDPQRVLVLATRASATAAVSSRHELYPVGMDAGTAVAAVLGYAPGRITPMRLRRLVATRFPMATPAPDHPQLDALVAAASTLTWDENEKAYVRSASTGATLLPTGTVLEPAGFGVPDEAVEALHASLRSHSALVVACPPQRLAVLPGRLAQEFGVHVVDVTALLIAAMRERASMARVDWSLVLRADAAPAQSADRANLDRLVADATDIFWPQVLADERALLLIDAAPLARYGQLARVAHLLDTAASRPAARWLLVPKRAGAAAPTLDGDDLPMASGTWIDIAHSLQESA